MFLVAVTSCGDSSTSGLPHFPTVMFRGQVVSTSGVPVSVTVALHQRFTGIYGACSPDNWVSPEPVTADSLGAFWMEYYAAFDTGGCFVFRATLPPDSLVLDSLVLVWEDFQALREPPGSDTVAISLEIN